MAYQIIGWRIKLSWLGCSLLARHGACGVTAPVDYGNVHHAAAAAVVAAAAAAVVVAAAATAATALAHPPVPCTRTF